MRHALPLALLLLSCSGDVFTRTPAGSGGVASSGGAPATGGRSGSGGAGGASLDASYDSGFDAANDAAPDAVAEALAPFDSCPPTPPPRSSSCTGTLDCAYGDDPRVTCREVHQCRSGRWLVSAKACAPLRFCSEFAAPPSDGAPCTTRDEFCTYAVGDDCVCSQGTALAWRCAPKPPAPCARRSENEGQPCGDAGGTCTYGPCGSADRVLNACLDGVWSWSTPLCN